MYALPPVSATKSSACAVPPYRFGPYEADLSRDELRKFGLRIRLEPKPWHLLIALLPTAWGIGHTERTAASSVGGGRFCRFRTWLECSREEASSRSL